MKRAPVALVLTAAIMVLLFLPGFAAANDEWPMYQANASHTGFVPVTLDPGKFALRWQKTLTSLALNPVTAAGGRVFVSANSFDRGANGNGPNLFTLDSASGDILWTKSFGDVYSVNPPSYSGGTVYIQTGQDVTSSIPPYLRAYDMATGALIFRSGFTAQFESYYAPTIYDGQVYMDGGEFGGMYSFDGSTGYQDWFDAKLPQYHLWTPAVDANSAYTYLGDQDPYTSGLYVIDRATGQQEFEITGPNFDSSSAVTGMGLAPVLGGLSDVFVTNGGRLIRFDLDARVISWIDADNFTGQPTVANGTVYAIDGGALGAYDQKSGAKLWMWTPPNGDVLEDTIIATKTDLFVGSQNNTYCLDLSSHAAVWTYPLGGHLSFGESTLYIAGSDGTLTAIGVGLPDIYTPQSVVFRQTGPGETTTETMSIRDVGEEPLVVQSIASSSAEFTAQTPSLPFTLTPGQSVSIQVSYTPVAGGTGNGKLLITSNTPDEPQASVALSKGFLVSATADAGGRISPSGATSVPKGGLLTFTVTPDNDQEAAALLVDGRNVITPSYTPVTYTLSDVTSDHAVEAVFSAACAVRASAGRGGQVSPSGTTMLAPGTDLTLTVTPNAGYQLTALLVDGVNVSALLSWQQTYTLKDITSDHTVKAVFTPYVDYFGIQAGDHFDSQVTDASGTAQTATDDISYDSTDHLLVDTQVLGNTTSQSGYYETSNTLLMTQLQASGETLTFFPGLPMIETPLAAGKSWTASSTFDGSNISGTAMITATVSPVRLVSVPAGHFMAWPITYTLTITANKTATETYSVLFAPYVGTIQSSESGLTQTLTAFKVGGGTVGTPPPVVTGVTPVWGPAGTQITINGLQFGGSQGAGLVTIGNAVCDQISSWSDTQIECTVPQAASSGPVVVFTGAWAGNNSIGFLTGLWQDAVNLGDQWADLSWFGAFNTQDCPWIYHQSLGWLYPIGTSTNSIWFFDPQWNRFGGYWWTSASVFPWVYSLSDGSWYYYDQKDSTPGARFFCNSSTGCATR